MPVTSMVKLARIDFQTTDPEALRVAVKLPQMLKARAEGTVLRIGVRLANGVENSRDFALREVNEREALAGEAAPGTELSAYALAMRDVAELRVFRAMLMQKQKKARADRSRYRCVPRRVARNRCRTGRCCSRRI
jgi:hypothetical protein